MSATCKHWEHNQTHKNLRETISRSDLQDLNNEDLRRILRIRRVKFPANANRGQLIALLRDSEGEDVGGYFHKYWVSPIGLTRRISFLSSNFTYKLVNNAVKIVAQDIKAEWLTWLTVADDRVCPICAPRHLRQYKPHWFIPQMPAHAGCFLEDTLVDTDRGLVPIQDVIVGDYVLTHKNHYRIVRQTHKNKYDGGVRELLGCWMTDNHRVLTPEGWCRSDSLQDGDKAVVSTLHLDRQNIVIRTKSYITPSTTTKKNLLSPILSTLRFGTMPPTSINFDGKFDGRNSEVDIINVKGICRDNNNVIGFEDSKIPLFERTEVPHFLHGLSIFNPFTSRGFTSSIRIMGRPILVCSLFGRHLTPTKSYGFSSSSDVNSFKFKAITDGSTRTVVLGSKDLHRHAPDIEIGDLLGGQDTLHYLTPTINDIDIDIYKGFVYNLTVDEDESYAVGEQRLLAHNCRCQWEVTYR